MFKDLDSILRAAAFDWETLVPILFFVLYGIAQFLGSKKKAPGEAEDQGRPEGDPTERARKIREEIQRKLEERRRMSEEGGPRVEPPQARSYDPNRPDGSQYQRPRPAKASPREAPRPKPVVKQARTVVSSNFRTNIEDRLRKQRERLAEARRRQDEARAQAVDIERRAGVKRKDIKVKSVTYEESVNQMREDLILGLRGSDNLRKVVLYREILDQPLGLR